MSGARAGMTRQEVEICQGNMAPGSDTHWVDMSPHLHLDSSTCCGGGRRGLQCSV